MSDAKWWTNCSDLQEMLAAIPDGKFDRELRLFSVACAQRVIRHLPEREFSLALACSKRYAIGECAASELQTRVDSASRLMDPHIDIPSVRDFAGSAVIDASTVSAALKPKVIASASCAAQAIGQSEAEAGADSQYDEIFDKTMASELEKQCDLLRLYIPSPNPDQ
ncbi:MAG: hypothetical protein COA78_11670 [Blastopirellula sp.]|nr:MAG: hypothetical protein COA78_11670 [Blastopirellula sp.]